VSTTQQLLRAWFDSVVRPKIEAAVAQGVPMHMLGAALIGAGVAAALRGGQTPDQVRQAVDDVLAREPPAPVS
jgi:hypothetical protein